VAASLSGDSLWASSPHVGAHPAPVTPTPVVPTTPVPTTRARAVPRIVKDHLRFTAQRKADTAAYAKRHYGVRTATLTPRLIVLHYTESDTYASARSVFAANEPDRGETPGTCAHYVVDQDGTVYELVPPTLICRHTIGLNHVAIGIEFVQASHGHDAQWAVQQILRRRAQVNAGVGLVRMLQQRYGIADASVIGHAMVNETKGFRDLEGWRNDHIDWQRPEVVTFRALVDAAR
jgi:N-acetyl-anhydromuramyl-L-alanine amidase AmpD